MAMQSRVPVQQKPTPSRVPTPQGGMFQRRPFAHEQEEDLDNEEPELQAEFATTPSLNLFPMPVTDPTVPIQRREEEEDRELGAIQPKLTIGQPGDKYEQEADSMAAQVMRMPDPQPDTPSLSTAQPTLQRDGQGAAPTAPTHFEQQMASKRGGGRPLSDETRSFMEPRFGQNFQDVRIHETPDLANSIQAQAFTHGQDIYFNSGKYNPGSSSGKELLAHELTHVAQQAGSSSVCSVQRTPKRSSVPKDMYGVNLVPPLRDPTANLGNPPLDLNIHLEPDIPLKPGLPKWFWKKLPPKPQQDSFIKLVSSWLTERLGRRDIARIAGQLAKKFDFDEQEVRKSLNEEIISGGEKGLEELLLKLLEEIFGKAQKIDNKKDNFSGSHESQSPAPKLPTPSIINFPPIKW